jgi:multidrug transporter EmrE-like cation transporter
MNASSTLVTWLLVLAAVVCNATAQVLMKRGGVTQPGDWHQWITPSLVGAASLYVVSFAITPIVYSRMPLSLISPLMAGAIFVLISIASVALLGEHLNILRGAGIACVLVGIYLLSQSQ